MRCVTIPIRVFLTVKVERGHAANIMKKLGQYSEVIESYAIADGVYDVVAFILVDDFNEYRAFALDKIGKMDQIEDYTSFITTQE